VITGQPEKEYIGLFMETTQIKSLNSTSIVSATIPAELLLSPAITYWIYVTDENLDEQESMHFSIGVKPSFDVDASLELDITTSKPEGTTIKPLAYLKNKGTSAAYGTISLVVNGEKVSSKAQLFKPGQTKVELEWAIPKVGKQMFHNVQAQADLYDVSLSTDSAKLNSFARSQIIPLSQMKQIETLTDDSGNVVAQPALLYASDPFNENLRFRVVDSEGQCIIGGTKECIVTDSTYDQRGGMVSIEQGEIIYRVKYSGPQSTLERFSITSIDPLPSGWTITLETIDDYVQQAYALKDINLKVKYRTISKIETVKSE
jgi:hypothetical protein